MYYLITNPASESGKDHGRILERAVRRLKGREIPCEVRCTEKGEDAEKIAAEITGRTSAPADADSDLDTIIVIGGDGTINGVINGIRDFSRVKFGFIPAGSANDFARGLGIRDLASDGSQRENLRSIADGKVKRILDLGQIVYPGGTRLFAVSAGIGFDAAVCRESDASRARSFFNALHLGKLTYGMIALKQLVSAPETKCEIRMKGGETLAIGQLVFATFMNTPFEGGGYKFAPDAVPDDGQINVSAIGDLSKFTVLINFPSAHKGTYYKVPGVFHAKAEEMHVQTEQPLPVHTDGEVIGDLNEFTIRCIPHALQLIL